MMKKSDLLSRVVAGVGLISTAVLLIIVELMRRGIAEVAKEWDPLTVEEVLKVPPEVLTESFNELAETTNGLVGDFVSAAVAISSVLALNAVCFAILLFLHVRSAATTETKGH